MEIKRNFEKFVITNRQFVIRQMPTVKQIACAECEKPMLTIEQTANLFGIKQRRIFRLIEIGATHFKEEEKGVLMICLNSLADFINNENQ